MKGIRYIITTLSTALLAVQTCISASPHHDIVYMSGAAVNGEADPLNQYDISTLCTLTAHSDGSIQVTMLLPVYFGTYAEVFGRTNLLEGQWQVLDSWVPTYGNSELIWNDVLRTNANAFFYIIHDATLDADGDGYSDRREQYISQTDPQSFDYADEDGDGMHDFWETKLFGNIWTQDGFDDSDGDGLPNHQELVWLAANTVRMVSDPSLHDTDGEGLDDFTELWMHTDPLSADTDSDGLNDAFEVLGSPPTDPNNPDILAPIVILAGG